MSRFQSKLIAMACILANGCFPVEAQSYHSLLSTGYSYASPNGIPVDNQVEALYLRASLPLQLKNKDYLLINPDLHRQTFVFNETQSYTCYKAGFSLAYMKLQEKGSVIGLLNFSNNFEKFRGFETMQAGAGVLVTRKQSERLKLKYGLYMNREFFGWLVVPLAGLDYKVNPKVRVFGILPQNMRLEIRHNKVFRSGIVFETPLNTYSLQGPTPRLYLDQRQILLGLFADIYTTKNVVLQVSIKQPCFNSHRLFRTEQTYFVSPLGTGIGGERARDKKEMAYFRHGTIVEVSLNYRIEIE